MDQYRRIFASKREEHVASKNHLTAGLSKLDEAAAAVAELSGQAAEQQTLLAEKQRLADEALSRITVSMSAASERKKEVESLKEKTSTEEKDLSVQKAGIEDELKDVQPLIDSARAAVGQIKSDNINEIKSLRTPPEGILAVLEAVLLLMNNPDTSWAGQKKFLGSRGVKEEIINFDAHVVTAKNREIVRKILKEKEELFEHKNILRVSVAAGRRWPPGSRRRSSIRWCWRRSRRSRRSSGNSPTLWTRPRVAWRSASANSRRWTARLSR